MAPPAPYPLHTTPGGVTDGARLRRALARSRDAALRRSTLPCDADNSCACRRRSHSGSGCGRDLEQEIRLEELQLLDRPTRRLDVELRLDPLAGGPPFQNPPEVDLYQAVDGRALAVAALSLPRTTTLRKWATLYVGSALPSFCKKSRGYRATTLGGGSALAFTGRCDIHDINVALTVHRGRAYVFALASPRAYSEAADGGVFEAARRSFRFVR